MERENLHKNRYRLYNYIMIRNIKASHGGKRKGAGRKAHGGKRMMFRISDEAQAVLAMVDDKSRFINDLIIKATR